MQITALRGILAITNLLAVLVLAGFGFWFAKELTTTQVAILMVPLTALTTELKVAYGFIFDGVPDKAPSAADKSPSTDPAP